MPDDYCEPFETGSDSFAFFALIQGWDLSLLRINDEDCWILMHPHDSDELRYQLRWIYAYVTNGLFDDAGRPRRDRAASHPNTCLQPLRADRSTR